MFRYGSKEGIILNRGIHDIRAGGGGWVGKDPGRSVFVVNADRLSVSGEVEGNLWVGWGERGVQV